MAAFQLTLKLTRRQAGRFAWCAAGRGAPATKRVSLVLRSFPRAMKANHVFGQI